MTNKKLKTVVLISVLLFPLSSLTLSAQTPPPIPTELKLDETLEREIYNNDIQEYQVPVLAGEFFQVRAGQKGVDTILDIYSPDGKQLAKMDYPNGRRGFETISCIAEKDGTYIVKVSRKPIWGFGYGPSTEYTITLITKRKLSDADRKRIEAEARFFAAHQIVLEKYEDIQPKIEKFEALLGEWRELRDDYVISVIERSLFDMKGAKLREESRAAFRAKKEAAKNQRRAVDKLLQLIVQTGHSKFVGAIAFSPDGKLLASTGSWKDETVKLWDIKTGKELFTLFGHNDGVFSAEFSPDGKILATGGGGLENDPVNVIKLWDVSTGQELRTLTGHTDVITTISFSPDGNILASGSSSMGDAEYDIIDETVKIWNIATGEELKSIDGFKKGVAAVKFSPTGKILATATGKVIKLWNVNTGTEIRSLTGHGSEVLSIAFSPDGSKLVSASGNEYSDSDNTIRLWDVGTGRELRIFPNNAQSFASVAIFPDGKTLATADLNTRIKLWDLVAGRELKSFDIKPSPLVRFSSDGKSVAAQFGEDRALSEEDVDNAINLFDLSSGRKLQTFSGNALKIGSIEFSPNGKLLAVASENVMRIWNISDGGELKTFKNTENIYTTRFSPDGVTHFSTGGNTIKISDARTGKEVRTLTGFKNQVTQLSLSPNGEILVAANNEALKIWNVPTGQELTTLSEKIGFAQNVVFSPDGKIMAGIRDSLVKLWDSDTGRELTTIDAATDVGQLSFSPNGKLIATQTQKNNFTSNCDCTITLWDVETGKEVKKLERLDYIPNAIVFSPDGKIAAWNGLYDDTIKLWHFSTSGKLTEILGHSDFVGEFVFSRDSKTIASVSSDRSVKFWDVASETEVKYIASQWERGHILENVILTSDGRLIRADTESNKIVLRDPLSESEIATLITFGNDSWIVATPDGRFDTNRSLDRIEGLHWAANNEILTPLPLDIFMRQYYEPGLLAKIVSGEKLTPLPPIAEINRVQPRISIKNISSVANDAGRINVTVNVENVLGRISSTEKTKKPLSSGVYDLRLFRDGQLVGVSTPKDKLEKFIDDAPRLVAETKASGKLIDTPEDRAWREANDLFKLKSPDIRIISPTRLEYTFRNIKLPRDGRKEVEFTAYAFNSDKVKSATAGPVKFAIPAAISNVPKKGRAFIVSIGVNASENPAYRLQYAANDARKTQEILGARLKAETSKYSEVIQIPLISDYGSNGTVAENTAQKEIIKGVFSLLSGNEKEIPPDVLKQIPNREKIKAVEPEDTLIISYSGHGYTNQSGIFYLLPYDIGKDTSALTAEALRKTISSDELSLWMRDITAQEMIMIVDACHSAAAVQGDGFKPGPMGSRGLGQLAYDKDMKILSATQADNVALEVGRLQQGLLSYALLQDGIVGSRADANIDKKISTVEWLSYAERRVPQLYQQVRDGKHDVVIDGNVIKAGGGRGIEAFSPINLKSSLNLQQPSLFDFKRRARETILFDLR